MEKVVIKVLKYNICTVSDVVQMCFSDPTCPSAVSLLLPVKVVVVAGVCVILLESRQSSREAKIEMTITINLELDKLVEVKGDGATIDCHKSCVSSYVSVTRQSSRSKKKDPPLPPILIQC